MTEMSVKPQAETTSETHADKLNRLFDALRGLWVPHRLNDLKVRHQMGTLLNDELQSPELRNTYGMATVERVSIKLDIHKSDISRMRRFAWMFKDFEAFQKDHPEATSWTRVRSLIAKQKDSARPADNRRARGVLRSLKSSAKSFGSKEGFQGPVVDEIRSALQELFQVAHTAIGFQLEELRSEDHQTDSERCAN